ncbi:hypothetical protein GE061_003809 [Apolygus lucorum]|uniref:DNA polymerase delta subunit 2 n=1 Tax=Apolygus lucorum TaxID=248454 RepID=A0A8S9X2L9_APOLU|nr:hypothetical protein GE061_003809 [Apolygus lucorum]
MRAQLTYRVRAEWGDEVEIKRLADLQDESESERCVLIGIVYKHQELHPSILKDISEELQVVPQQKMVRFVDEKDELILEDEVQRIRLCGDIDVHSLVTGVVVALLGRVSSDRFNVEKVCYSGPMSPSGLTLKAQDPERYLVIVSGFELAHASDSLLPLKMFTDWVTGWLGDPSDQHRNSRIALVLIAGNLLRGISESKDGKIINTNVENSSDVLTTVKAADDILADLAETVHVELMPGEFDPTNLMLPQQPLHYKMFPSASSFSSLHGATNPHSFEVENRLVTGSSGQSIDDIGRYSNLQDPLEALESTFRWGHISPTCPDTLPSYPYFDDDPFVIDRQPDIYFSANHDQYQSKMISCTHKGGIKQDVRLVVVPSFNKTKSCVVIVDLRKMTVHSVLPLHPSCSQILVLGKIAFSTIYQEDHSARILSC